MLSPRLELTGQGLVQHTNVQSRAWYHSTIQAPLLNGILNASKNEFLSIFQRLAPTFKTFLQNHFFRRNYFKDFFTLIIDKTLSILVITKLALILLSQRNSRYLQLFQKFLFSSSSTAKSRLSKSRSKSKDM